MTTEIPVERELPGGSVAGATDEQLIAACLIRHDVQHNLVGTRAPTREGVVGGEGEREAGSLPGGAVLIVDDVAQAVIESVKVPSVVVRES